MLALICRVKSKVLVDEDQAMQLYSGIVCVSYGGTDDYTLLGILFNLPGLIKAEFDKLKKGRTMPQQWDNPPDLHIDHTKQYHCLMQTSKGQIEIQLYANAAPVSYTHLTLPTNREV